MKLRLRSKTIRRFLFVLLCLVASGLADGQGLSVTGRVIDGEGHPVAGATVVVKGGHNGTITDEQGRFLLKGEKQGVSLLISSIGFEKQEVKATERKGLTVTLKRSTNQLDQTVIRAYGTTTRRLNTGDISTVTAKEIGQQPVSNPLAALEGRVPGLVVTQTSGVHGASLRVQIRGQNSISQGSDPLFVIDGVPYSAGNGYLNQFLSAAGNPEGNSYNGAGLSPLGLINPDDIESIEILKDADATAIYGSRGANGVILITTKKGRVGKTRFNGSIYSGISAIATKIDFLNTKQYLQMRREAFSNDGLVPNNEPGSAGYAPDLTIWDTTRYTNFEKLLMGGKARFTDAHASFSGGTKNIRMLLGGGYHRQSSVFPGDFIDEQASVHSSSTYESDDNKFSSTLVIDYANEENHLPLENPAAYLYLPPDAPALYDSSGKLNWQEKGVYFNNPLTDVFQKYKAQTSNLLGNFQLRYKLLDHFTVKANLGYNTTRVNESDLVPVTAMNPESVSPIFSDFGNSYSKSWIAEPQMEYVSNLLRGRIDILVGGTWQEAFSNSFSLSGSGYPSDALLGSIAAASNIRASNSSVDYKYNAFFGRVNYDFDNKYIINLSGRRDGSSRFGPGKKFSDFWAIGTAWIFSKESFFRRMLPVLSFGKLRASYGITGNDQIGDYQYLDAWGSTSYSYTGVSGLYPVRLSNADYGWEINRKLEAAIDLGFINDRILISASYFRNRSGNQLIDYSLPIQTGFSNVNRNFDALVQNEGSEFSLDTKNIDGQNFKWETEATLTIDRNKLVRFPGLASSSYASRYVIGRSLSVLRGYKFLGVDPNTGIYTYGDLNKDGKINYPGDYTILGDLDPKFYGGLRNVLTFRQWRLSFFFQFRKQIGRNYLYNQMGTVPGREYNQPAIVLTRWQKSGDMTAVQKYTTTTGTPAYNAIRNLPNSDGIYSDASFIRAKNFSLSYTFPQSVTTRLKINDLSAFIQGQNIFTVTSYKVGDPEVQNMYVVPPLRTIVGGIHIIF